MPHANDTPADLRVGFDYMTGNKPGSRNLLIIKKSGQALGAYLTKFVRCYQIGGSVFTRTNSHRYGIKIEIQADTDSLGHLAGASCGMLNI